MYKATRRAIVLFCSFIGITIGYTLLYDWMYDKYEEGTSSYINSLQTVVEALTTAGFGGQAPWSSDLVNLLVISMNITGVTVFFFTIPLVVIPYLKKNLSEPPKSTSKEDHIVVVSDDQSANKMLIKELSKLDRSYVFVENDRERASELYRRDIPVVQANPETREGMTAVNLQEASSLVANITQSSSLTILYTAKQINNDMRIISVAEDRKSEKLCYSAGADKVLNLSTEIGEILSEHSVSTFSGAFEDIMNSNDRFEMTKLVVFEGSPIAGIDINQLSQQYLDYQDVIAGHFGRDFLVSPSGDRKITKNAVLYLSGPVEDIDKTESQEITKSSGDKILICGAGKVGREVSRNVDSEFETVTIDIDKDKNPDIVGDVTSPDMYNRVGLEDYKSVVLAIDDDVSAVYACSMISNITENTKIVCRANSIQSVQNMYLAGADQVILVPKLLDAYRSSEIGEMSTDNLHTRVETSIIENQRYEGAKIPDTNIGEEIGSRIIAIKKNGSWITTKVSEKKLNIGDYVVVVGRSAEIEKTEERLQTPKEQSD